MLNDHWRMFSSLVVFEHEPAASKAVFEGYGTEQEPLLAPRGVT